MADPAAGPDVERLEFRAMATRVELVLVGPRPGALDWARHRVSQLEDRWSRFLPHSQVTALNRAGGRAVPVHPDTIRLLVAMRAAHEATGGRFDPTMLAEIVDAGYDRSIEDPSVVTAPFDRPTAGAPARFPDCIQVDAEHLTATLTPGVSIDPGGIGKGLAADIVVTELLAAGTRGALVGIGGDIAAAGTPPSGDSWSIAVEDPFERRGTIPEVDDQRATVIEVSAGGVATSSTMSRRWVRHGVEHHHQLDPSTRSVSGTDVGTVTVVADAGWLAEAHATAAILAGTAGAVEYLVAHGLAGVVIGADGAVHRVGSQHIEALEAASAGSVK